MNATQFGESAKIAAVDAMQKMSDESVEFVIGTKGAGAEFTVMVQRRPESQIEERRKRKELGERLY